MMISIYSELIPYHFIVDGYDFYRTDIFHDFTAKNKINIYCTYAQHIGGSANKGFLMSMLNYSLFSHQTIHYGIQRGDSNGYHNV